MSAYGNPAPYPSVELERHMLTGRLHFQRSRLRDAQARGNADAEERARGIIDELLDHLFHVRERVDAAVAERARRLVSQ